MPQIGVIVHVVREFRIDPGIIRNREEIVTRQEDPQRSDSDLPRQTLGKRIADGEVLQFQIVRLVEEQGRSVFWRLCMLPVDSSIGD